MFSAFWAAILKILTEDKRGERAMALATLGLHRVGIGSGISHKNVYLQMGWV